VPWCGQGQGQRRDDDLFPQWRAPTQLAADSQWCLQPGLQRKGNSFFVCCVGRWGAGVLATWLCW
jgi:hypothetical protein